MRYRGCNWGIWVHLMHEFGVPKLFRVDRNERVQTTILGPRIMLELICTICLTRCHGCNWGYLGALNARVLGAENFSGQSQQMGPNSYLGHRIMLELVSHHLLDALSWLQLGVSGCI